MVAELGEVSQETATKLLKETGNNVKTAIVMAKRKINILEAEKNLKAVDGILSKII
jgi:N-acetylmuramic acid 6-phosphate (MurNAc-6-P) etherase